MEKESVKVLQECIDLQLKKANDYQNPKSKIKQADYYPRGIHTIVDIIWAKILRTRSVLEAQELDPDYAPNFESMEDSLKDLINYASFGVAWLRGGIDGQQEDVKTNGALNDETEKITLDNPRNIDAIGEEIEQALKCFDANNTQ